MFYQLAPSGNRVLLSKDSDWQRFIDDTFAPLRLSFFQSGTAALASVLVFLKDKAQNTDAEVLLPAYACPDLISACVYAGVKPVLVDFAEDLPYMDLAGFEASINANTLAVIAVEFLGISERYAQMRNILAATGIALIQDSAQYFPGRAQINHLQGDYIVLSFGRGKPVSLLSGGAVLTKNAEFITAHDDNNVAQGIGLSYYLKLGMYNFLIRPWVYWLPNMLPFLNLGQTRYKTLDHIHGLAQDKKAMLPANINSYWQGANLHARISTLLANLDSDELLDLPRLTGTDSAVRLLRYPVLVHDAGCRAKMYEQLLKHGMGVSLMYEKTLPEIELPGVDVGHSDTYPHAKKFAKKLLTLPTHAFVTDKQLQRISDIVAACLH